MAFDGFLITEIFFSLQGETSASGLPFIFIRLTGCNLRCTYCDSAYAFKNGQKMSLLEIVEHLKTFPTNRVLITGGEPLVQRNTPTLIRELTSRGFEVSVETHGELPIDRIVDHARIILDIKTPDSGMQRGGWEINVKQLKPNRDEIKFVITSDRDYEWARNWVREHAALPVPILFSPMVPAEGSPKRIDQGFSPTRLADRILKDGLNVRFQMQLHKILWGNNTKGV